MPEFPQTAELSPLDPPAENPLSEGGAWLQLEIQPPLQKLSTGDLTDSIHGDTNYSYWARDQFDSSGLVEVWACIDGGQLGAAIDSWRVLLAHSVGGDWDGYLVLLGGGILDDIVIRRYDNGVPTGLISVSGGSPRKIGMRINGPVIEAWSAPLVGAWSLITSVTDTTYRGQFYAGFGIEDPTGGGVTISCVGGGVPNRTQIYRVVPGLT